MKYRIRPSSKLGYPVSNLLNIDELKTGIFALIRQFGLTENDFDIEEVRE